MVDAWKQRKLGDLAEISRGASPRPIQDPKWFDKDSDVGWLRIADVTEQNGRIHHLEQHISSLGQEKTRVLLKPHLLLSIAATVGKPVVNYVKTGVHDGFLIFYHLKPNREFIFQWLEMFRPRWQKYGQPGSQVNLNSELVRRQEIFLPEDDEQDKIVQLLEKFDDTIALHERKLELLKQLKKAYLQQLFPANGSRVPRMRFAGFTDDWEQRKLTWMLDENDGIRRGPFGSALKKTLFVPASSYVVYEQQNAIYDRYNTRYNISERTFQKLSRFEIHPGDFIMSGAGTIGRISRVPEGIKAGVFNQALIRFKIDGNKTDDEYFLQLIRSPQMQRRLTESNPGSAITNLVPMSEVKNWELLVPVKAEQSKIAYSLRLIDDTIALHQRKIEIFRKLKKAYLQKLFI